MTLKEIELFEDLSKKIEDLEVKMTELQKQLDQLINKKGE